MSNKKNIWWKAYRTDEQLRQDTSDTQWSNTIEFEQEINSAHNFNKYLKELSERYG